MSSPPNPDPDTCPPLEDDDSSTSLLLTLSTAALTALATYYLHRKYTRPRTPSQPPSAPPSTPAAVSALARLWLAQDPDPITRSELELHLHALQTDPTLRRRLAIALDPVNRLKFGTAGIRAEVGLGYDRLNLVNVLAVARAVVAVLNLEGGLNSVVVGYDGRPDSERFAVAISSVFESERVEVALSGKPVPTPFVAYGVLIKGADVGFCVTASHNKKSDNGVKVFWRDGIQIGADIAKKIEEAVRVNRGDIGDVVLDRGGLGKGVVDCLGEIEASYYRQIVKTVSRGVVDDNLGVVYTACHGVGWEYVGKIFKEFGLGGLVPVEEQCEIDGTFPTLPFPNPEEKGALDLAVGVAREKGCRLVLANDPDADRLGAAEIGKGGKPRVFTGNEIAVLLADYLTAGREGENMEKYAVVASTVSSKIIQAMARKRGFVFREALTGFKWLNKVAVDMQEKEGKVVLLTYEEALGFNITRNIVRDKDGVSAAALFAEMTGAIYKAGKTLSQRLDELLDECGVHLAKNGYLKTSATSATTTEIFESARNRGLPTMFGKAVVKSVRDLTRGTDSGEVDGKARLPADASSQFLTFRCDRSGSEEGDEPLIIHLRGSGTEPKIKYYSELRCSREDSSNGTGMAFLESAVQAAIDEILRPKENRIIG